MNKTLNAAFVSLVFLCSCAVQDTNVTQPVPTPVVETPAPSVQKSKVTATQGGKASVYSDKLQGKKTAAGEAFDQDKLTAASKSLPLGSQAKVTNKKTGKSTTVTITDRGPYVKGRAIDLSKSAAKQIDIAPDTVGDVKIEKIK